MWWGGVYGAVGGVGGCVVGADPAFSAGSIALCLFSE